MGAAITASPWLAFTLASPWLAFTLASFTALSVYILLGKKNRRDDSESKIRELEKSLKISRDNCAAERQGRIRAHKALRKALLQHETDNVKQTSYPMVPIGIVQSCFSTRNGTPRQPLLVPLARACLTFDPARAPPASLEGLEEYSHIWIIYVFHLNTDLDKLWLEPSKSKIKAKVRVPRLKGGKKGVFATRSPHRPSPIGLTVAKIEAVKGSMILLSGVDLVDGTPVLDVKPYLPYCDSIQDTSVPDWVKADSCLAVASVTFSEGFIYALTKCWELVEKTSLYSTPNEMKILIEQVLSWDIRSPSQRDRPHNSLKVEDCEGEEDASDLINKPGISNIIIYHLILEGLDISYMIDFEGNVHVENVTITSGTQKDNRSRCNYKMWSEKTCL